MSRPIWVVILSLPLPDNLGHITLPPPPILGLSFPSSQRTRNPSPSRCYRSVVSIQEEEQAHEVAAVIKAWRAGVRGVGLSSSSATSELCDLGKVTRPLWTSL